MKKQERLQKKVDYQKRQHALDAVRSFYDMKVNYIRALVYVKYPEKVWSFHALNWPHWDKFRVLLCNTYGVSCVDQIPEELVDDANITGIAMLTIMFDANLKALDLAAQALLLNEEEGE